MKFTRVLPAAVAASALVLTAAFVAPSADADTTSAARALSAKQTLDASLRVPGTAFAIDPASNKVVLSYDSTVTGAKLDQVKAAASKLGSSVTLEKIGGKLSTKYKGGDSIYGGDFVCSLGFNVKKGNNFYFLTAGHCGQVANAWYGDTNETKLIATNVNYNFPKNDFALMRYRLGQSHPGEVHYGLTGSRDIKNAGNATVNQKVNAAGQTTGPHAGTVKALNQTVNYDDGTTVYGLIRTNICAEPGDSGGPLYAGNTALGLTSGGTGDCTTGGITFYQPVTEALRVYGASVY
jgi:hypothetical protein